MAERYRDLDLLHPDFRPVVDRFLAKCVEAQIMVMVVETWRSQAAHEEDVKNGRSWVQTSKHQNMIERQLEAGELDLWNEQVINWRFPASLAIDIAPYEVYQLNGPDKLEWDADDPAWALIGMLGESIGLKWGGRWPVKDMAHFEASWI